MSLPADPDATDAATLTARVADLQQELQMIREYQAARVRELDAAAEAADADPLALPLPDPTLEAELVDCRAHYQRAAAALAACQAQLGQLN